MLLVLLWRLLVELVCGSHKAGGILLHMRWVAIHGRLLLLRKHHRLMLRLHVRHQVHRLFRSVQNPSTTQEIARLRLLLPQQFYLLLMLQ
jgi:hypothetical protein